MIGLLLFIAYWVTLLAKRYSENLFILLLQATGCFQLVPVGLLKLDPVITKPYDWLSLIIIITLITKYRSIPIKKYLTLPVRVFFGFLAFLVFYSLIILKVEMQVVLSVFRLYLFFASPILFINYDYKILQKAMKPVVFLVAIGGVLFILQAIIGTPILASLRNDSVISKEKIGAFSRFYNLPYYGMFVLFYCVNKIVGNFNLKYFAYAGVLFVAIILSFDRNHLVAAIVGCIAVFFHNRKFKVKDFVLIVLASWIFMFALSQMQSKRLNQGFADIQNLSGSISLNDVGSSSDVRDLSTTQFRAFHFSERFLYVIDKGIGTTLFGIGLVNENSHIVTKLDFLIGLIDDQNHIVQVDTADIVWSLLLLQTGLVGIGLFIWMFVRYIKFFFKNREYTLSYLTGIYLSVLLFTSFFGIEITIPPVILFFSMMYVLTVKVTNSVA
ncbi:hypothetical protein [Mucilaginibacter endophyticus]|uniref:hypothetical protein n=1 Tax=Mucilaginibacter endophyticus TaxID=2675003 RepID=UPI000E0DD063|nr:hypothetical protein [Mucilaginibacter endophyticus]